MQFSLVGKVSKAHRFEYSWRDVVLYALGVGAKRAELDFLYEGTRADGKRGPLVLPSFAVVPKFGPMMELLQDAEVDLAMVVHGGEKIELLQPLPHEGVLLTTATIRGIYDMRKFAFVLVDTESKNEAGEVITRTTSNIIVREAGGFGGGLAPKEETFAVPKDVPVAFQCEEKTSEEQALLYRLSGDYNPLHADPAFAKKVGFDQPILHGLCTYGYAVRHLVNGLLGGDPTRLRSFDAQFKRPVLPGDTFVTEGFRGQGDDEKKVAVRVSVKPRAVSTESREGSATSSEGAGAPPATAAGEQVLGRAWARLA